LISHNMQTSLDSSWSIPPPQLTLSQGEIHIWCAELDCPQILVNGLFELLTCEEQRRAANFQFERDKNRFIAARGILRSIIGHYYLKSEPARVAFRSGLRGKPYLEPAFEDSTLDFNQADSGGLALYAFARGHEIGIDIEYRRSLTDFMQIADSTFSAYEKQTLAGLPEEAIQTAFYNCWTRKEAFVKAIGEGLYFDLDKFDVTCRSDEPPMILRIDDSPVKAGKWRLTEINTIPGFAATLAYQGTASDLKYWKFSTNSPNS